MNNQPTTQTSTMETTTQPNTQPMETSPNAQKTTHGDEYGWFSATSKARGNPTHIYLDESGARVEVTCVTRTTNHGSGWDDIVYVGKVYKYVERRRELTKYVESTVPLNRATKLGTVPLSFKRL